MMKVPMKVMRQVYQHIDLSHYNQDVDISPRLQWVIRLVQIVDDLEADITPDRFRARADFYGHPARNLTDLDIDRLLALVAPVRAVFAAGTDTERTHLVNDLLAATTIHPVVADVATGRLTLINSDILSVDDLIADHALALADGVIHHGARMRACDNDRCLYVFIDATRNHSARFCSTTCANSVHGRERRAHLPR